MRNRKKLILIVLLACAWGLAYAQQEDLLEKYIQLALETNHGLKEKEFLLEKNRLALEEAKRLFRPEVGFGVTYTMSAGGRNISIPVGDLMNPVYSTLNQITMSNAFPQIENVEERFLPSNFYDARFRIRQPIVQREIYFNKKIKQEMIGLREAEIAAFKRELAKEVKTAYFQYLQASEAVGIYENALVLLVENKRVQESLLKNDKVIPSVLLRVQSEITQVQAQRNEASAVLANAAAYLNFLQNNPLDAPIPAVPHPAEAPVPEAAAPQTENREELTQLRTLMAINALAVELENAYKVPQVGLQVDVGSQNFDFKYGGYMLAGLSVEMPIYAANRNKLQVQQAELDLKATAEKLAQAEKQFDLEATVANNALTAAVQTWQSFRAQVANAQRQYDDTLRRYKEGLSNYIETLDARTQLTNIQLQQSVALYGAWIKKAELDRAVGR